MKFRKLKFKESFEVKKIYDNSSQELRDNFHPVILNDKFYLLVLSITPLGSFLPKRYSTSAFVVTDNDKIVGFIYISGSENHMGLFVREGCQGKGIATFMIKEMKKRFDYIKASFYENNIASIKLHEKAGFEIYEKISRWKRKKNTLLK